jgi:hypothetical protein
MAMASVLAGCRSGGPAINGPLRSGSDPDHGSACAPGRVGQPRSFGISQFTNHGHVVVVLDRVTLQHPHHLRLVGSYAVPGAVLIGVGGWVPKYAAIPSAWRHRQAVHGFHLAAGKTFNMVLGVEATAIGKATSPGMLVYYHDSSGSYVTKDDVGMTIGTSKSGCN